MNNEEIYNELNASLIPQIQQWLSISKDYFTELFWRTIKYLIIQDFIAFVIYFILLIIWVFCFLKFKNNQEYDSDSPNVFILGICGILIWGYGVIFSFQYLLQDIYVPEYRIYQIIKWN